VGVTAETWRRPPRRNRLWPSSAVFYNDLALVILASSAMFSVNIVGSLPGCEIVALVMLPFLLLKHGQRAFRREYRWFYLLLALWLIGTIAGDLYLQGPMNARAKGIARVLCLGLDFTTLAILINGKTRGFIAFTVGFIPFMLYVASRFRADFLVAWKFGLGFSITLLLLLLSSYLYVRRKHWIYISISLGIAALNLVFAARSQILIDLVSLALILPIFEQKHTAQRGAVKGRETLKVAVLLALAGGAAFAANQAIKFATNHNFFDESIRDKFQNQEEGELGILVGGRPETLVAIQAIRDSPLLGHGSYAVDPKYTALEKDLEYRYGYSESDVAADEESPGIPAHSHLTQAWVESGVFGGIFWMYALLLAFRGTLVLISHRPPMTPLYSFLLAGFLWDVLYSPMGSFGRMWGAFAILISYNLLRASRENRLTKPVIERRFAVQPRRTEARRRYIGPALPGRRLSGSTR
jgi:O-antigen ligase